MKNIFPLFLIMFFSFLFLLSCENDIDNLLQVKDLEIETSIRSTGNGCTNFVRNGEFADNTIDPMVNGDCEDNLDKVNFWTKDSGVPFVVVDGCLMAGCTVDAHLDVAISTQASDVVSQNLVLPTDPDIIFWMCYDASSVDIPLNLQIDVGNFQTVQLIDHPYTVCPSPQNPVIFANYTTVDFQLGGIAANTLQFSVPSMPQGADELVQHIDNVALYCKSELLTGIHSDQNGCTFNFRPVIDLPGLNITSFLWEFGDGNTSNQNEPQHTYAIEDAYTVTLTIEDDRGCCTIVSTEVSCAPPICTYRLCWDEMPNRITSFNVENTAQLLWTPFLDISGNHQVIRNTILNHLTIEQVDFGTFVELDPNCTKNGVQMPSFIFVDSPTAFVSFEGFNLNSSNGWVPYTADFTVENCSN